MFRQAQQQRIFSLVCTCLQQAGLRQREVSSYPGYYFVPMKFKKLVHLQMSKTVCMLTKDKLQKSIANLPESFSIDELIDQLIFIEKIEEGIVESEAGKTVSNEDVKSMIDKWSS